MSNEIEIKKGNEFDNNSSDLAELIYESFKEKADALIPGGRTKFTWLYTTQLR